MNLDELSGKILRLNPDGSVPDDNPYPKSLVWSYGHRNPQGLVQLPSGRIFSSEHGGGQDDELNEILPDNNYGWPEVHGYCNWPSELAYCANNEVKVPLRTWSPAYAPCGLAYYNHPAIPEWNHSLLQVFLKAGDGSRGQRLEVLQLNEAEDSIVKESTYFTQTFGRLRDVLVAPDGRVFLCTSNKEKNGDMVVQANDDKIIELRNLEYPLLPPEPPDFIPEEVLAFPMPTDENLFLKFPVSEGEIHIRIIDPIGRKVYEESATIEAYTHLIDASGIQRGSYIMLVELPDGRRQHRKIQIE